MIGKVDGDLLGKGDGLLAISVTPQIRFICIAIAWIGDDNGICRVAAVLERSVQPDICATNHP
jgi:hypothetical protein